MAKDKLEVKVLPPEAAILFAAVAMHAFISAGKTWSKKSFVEESFELGDLMVAEARKRGYKID